MAFIENTETVAVEAVVTRLGRKKLLSQGYLDIDRFRLFDAEINYQNINLDESFNLTNDDPDIISQSVSEVSDNELNADYLFGNSNIKGQILNSPYFSRNQQLLIGNTIQTSPFYAQNQNITINIQSLSSSQDFENLVPAVTGVTKVNSFYSGIIVVTDSNGSIINGSSISMYVDNQFVTTQTTIDSTQQIFNNLSGGHDYKFVVTNQGYSFFNANAAIGAIVQGSSYEIQDLESNIVAKFIGTSISIGTPVYSVSGIITNGITTNPIESLSVNIHYGNNTFSTTTDVSGDYSFAGLSSNTQYFLSIDDSGWYYDSTVSTTGSVSANMVNNIIAYPRSVISGYVYFNNTTNPISNAVISLYSGVTGGTTNTYNSSVFSDQYGFYTFPNIFLLQNYNITATLNGFTFVNLPLQLSASSVTGSVTGVNIFGLNNPAPLVPDSPFPRRRVSKFFDKTDLPVFYDECSWIFYTEKIGTLYYATNYNYSPIQAQQVLQSTNYFNLIDSLEGPYTFVFNSIQSFTDSNGNVTTTPYISDSYIIKICLYVLDYKYSLPNNLPQWDETSKTDLQISFPQQINKNASDIIFNIGDTENVIDIVPNLQNQALALNLSDVNNLLSLLPQQQISTPIVVNTANTEPNLGLYLAQGFNIDNSILNIQLSPSSLAQNSNIVSYVSIQGAQKQVPIEVTVTNYESVTTTTPTSVTNTQTYNINGNPLPIFLPDNVTLQNTMFQNNLAYGFTMDDLINTIRSNGFIFDRIVSWSLANNSYSINTSLNCLTINTFGPNGTLNQLLYTVNGTHYTVAADFIQFLISYFGIPPTDAPTLDSLFKNNGLVDWLFFIFVINFGAFYNAYNNGLIQNLISLTQTVKYGILIDILSNKGSVTTIVNDFINRQNQPSLTVQQLFGTNFASNGTNSVAGNINSVANTSTNSTAANINSINSINANGTNSVAGNINSVANTSTNSTAANINSINTVATATNGTNSINTVATNGTNTNIVAQTETSSTNMYAFVGQNITNAITLNIINGVINALFNFVSFNYKTPYIILVNTISKTVTNNTTQVPVQVATVSTQTITPIIAQVINISNANNFFNQNPSLDTQLTLTLSFDLTNSSTQDNFLKMINYLNAQLYTTYLGVEIIDNGTITQNLNSNVKQITEFINAPINVQNLFCTMDKVEFLVPLTIGGISISQNTTTITNPSNFNGIGYIRYITFNDNPNIAHLVRLIKLSNVTPDMASTVNTNIISGSDYIAFDVLQIDTTKNINFPNQLLRFIQLLSTYNYNTMNLDITQLRSILSNQYSNISGVTYVGSFGPAFASTTNPPNFWNSQYINYTQGLTPIAILQNIFATGIVSTMGLEINSVSDFTSVGSIGVLQKQQAAS